MSVITEEMKARAEVYHGDELCQLKSKEFLKDIALPNGLLPLKEMEEVGYDRESGFVWLKQKNRITHKFDKIGKLVSYEPEVIAQVEQGRIKKLRGVKSKEILIWVSLSDIYLDDPPTGRINFKSYAGPYRSFPVSAFELLEDNSTSTAAKDNTNAQVIDDDAAAAVKEV